MAVAAAAAALLPPRCTQPAALSPLPAVPRSPTNAMAAAGGEPGALAAQCKELQRQLDAALRERDELVRDLESFCLSDGGTTFNSSSVLQERIYSTGARAGRAALGL